MPDELDNAVLFFENFAREVLAPALFFGDIDLTVEVFQCPTPVSPQAAAAAAYQPTAVGFRWGPVWSTAWFHLTGQVPESMSGRTVVLRFSTGTEATLWRDGVPYHGLDANHEYARLFAPARGGETVDLHIEAACNRPWGVQLFPWESAEEHLRWSEPLPGRLQRCSLAVLEEDVRRLLQAYAFATQLLRRLPPDFPRRHRLRDALLRASRAVNIARVADTAAAALAELRGGLHRGVDRTAAACVAVGHAHLDTAWLWPIRETRRKCLRTFATVLRLMERHPDLCFLASQAQHYAWVEEDSPKLFAQIAARVREGRWEAGGAMWVESDCNLPNGESLVRQILHGVRYWQARFGRHAPQRHLYLPDTFGFCAALPQIMRLSGLDTFITNKLAWNDTNEFPHVTFVWRGLDGSEVLAHSMPGGDYNSDNRPQLLLDAAAKAARLDRARVGLWLQPFGYGDGGGGPSEETILNADLAGFSVGLPIVRHGRVDQFCGELHRRFEALPEYRRAEATWAGELYLECHRGTYTSQAWIKRANRRLEEKLRTAEWLSFFGPAAPTAEESAAVMRRLDRAWKLLLLNQFHDILPGSSIGMVYDQARAELGEVESSCDELIEESLRRWGGETAAAARRQPLRVWNPASHDVSGVVEHDGRLIHVPLAPALGLAPVDPAAAPPPDVPPVKVDGWRLSNGLVEVEIDESGRISSLRGGRMRRESCARGAGGDCVPLNQLVLYPDVPGHYDAWEIARHDQEPGDPVVGPVERREVVEAHPLRAAIEVERPIGVRSRIIQRYLLAAGSPRLDIRTRVDWGESRTLLRAVFPVAVRADAATYETQFGHLSRPVQANTSWEKARYEVPAQRWMDLSQPGLGLAVLNDGKYGHSCRANVLGLSLLRSPVFPDPRADQGWHEFTYSLMPHDGDWRAAGVAQQAEALNRPLLVRSAGAASLAGEWRPFEATCSDAASVEVVALKRAEDDHRLILRLVEVHGGVGSVCIRWRLPVKEVEPVDLLERPMVLEGFAHDRRAGQTTLRVRGFQVCSLAVVR